MIALAAGKVMCGSAFRIENSTTRTVFHCRFVVCLSKFEKDVPFFVVVSNKKTYFITT